MTAYAPDQLIMLALVFALGLLIGMFAMAGGKWKRLYQEQVDRTEHLEGEVNRLERESREMESLRHAAAKTPPRDTNSDRTL